MSPMGFGPQRIAAAARAAWSSEPREEVITDRYALREVCGRLYKFDTATGQTWRLEEGRGAGGAYAMRWVVVEHEPTEGKLPYCRGAKALWQRPQPLPRTARPSQHGGLKAL